MPNEIKVGDQVAWRHGVKRITGTVLKLQKGTSQSIVWKRYRIRWDKSQHFYESWHEDKNIYLLNDPLDIFKELILK